MVLTKAMQELRNLLGSTDVQTVTKHAEMLAKYNLSVCTADDIEEVMVPYINRLLNQTRHRHDALHILNGLLSQLPTNVIHKHSTNWSRCVNDRPVTSLQLSVLIKLIKVCHGITDFDKHLTQNLVEMVRGCLSEQGGYDIRTKLDCVTLCFKHYPKSFTPLRVELENTLNFYLSSDYPRDVLRRVGTLLHALQEIPVNNWTSQFYKLCATVHKLYDDFLNGFEFHQHNYNKEVEPLEDVYLTIFAGDKVDEYTQLYNRLRNVVIFMKCMLEEKFSQPKILKLSILMDVLHRGLTVETYQKRDPSPQHGFVDLLQKHQVDLLYLFESFITCFNKQLLPLSARITKLIVTCQELSQQECFPQNSEYLEALYDLLRCWVVFSHNDGDVIPYNKIIPLMLIEITPTHEGGALCLNKSAKSAIYSAPEIKNILRTPRGEEKSLRIDETACDAIFKALHSMMCTVELDLNDANTNTLFQVLVEIIEAVQTGEVSPPYTSSECVASLYRAFSSLFMQQCYRKRPFYELAINLLTDGQNCEVNDFRITYVIIHALQIINTMCRTC